MKKLLYLLLLLSTNAFACGDELLLHCDGADGSTTFTDSGDLGLTITPAGNAQIDTAQFKFGTASGLFDGTGDYISAPDNAAWNFGTGAFTIDFWVRFNSLVSSAGFFQQRASGDNNYGLSLSGSNIAFEANSGGATIVSFSGAWSPSINTWYHIAVMRGYNGGANDWIITVDGVEKASVTDADGIPDLGATLDFGKNDGFGTQLNGWLDEIHVNKGAADFAVPFTPPSSAYCATASTRTSDFMEFFDT